MDVLIATGRMKHSETPPPAPRGRIPKDATVKERMARKLRTKAGKAAYARRKAMVEPVFGQIDTCQGGKRVLLRGLAAADAEWALLAACHNLRKLFTHTGTTGLASLAGSGAGRPGQRPADRPTPPGPQPPDDDHTVGLHADPVTRRP